MLAEERRSKIQELLFQESTVAIAELAQLFGTSEMTIRRDLDALEARGVCKRIHGGAMSLRSVENRGVAYPAFSVREQAQAAEKAAIAREAAALVQPGDTIVIDSGTTASHLARALRGKEAITVISNSVQVLEHLYDVPGIVSISPGGILAVEDGGLGVGEWTFAGPLAVAALRRFHASKAFITTSGITLPSGITNASLFQAEIKRLLIEIADEVILLTDHTKFGRANGIVVAPVSDFDIIITDTSAPAGDVQTLRDMGIEVVLTESTGAVSALHHQREAGRRSKIPT